MPKGIKGFQKGHPSYHTKESKKSISDTLKGHLVSEKTRKKIGCKNKGRKFSKEICEKMKGRNKGEKSHFWKGGISRNRNYKRFKCLEYRGRKIENGGFHILEDWEELKKQYNYICPCCKRKEPIIKLTEDHIIPLSKGGSDNIENIQPLCGLCNSKKGTKTLKYKLKNKKT